MNERADTRANQQIWQNRLTTATFGLREFNLFDKAEFVEQQSDYHGKHEYKGCVNRGGFQSEKCDEQRNYRGIQNRRSQ